MTQRKTVFRQGWRKEEAVYEGARTYLEDKVASATPGQLVELLFDRGCRDLEQAALLAAESKDPRCRADALRLVVHAQRIIAELSASLNRREGGELAQSLARVYEYMQYRLTETAQALDPAVLREVHDLLASLHEAWCGMLDGAAAPTGASPTGPRGTRTTGTLVA